jgi:hypothetical protein
VERLSRDERFNQRGVKISMASLRDIGDSVSIMGLGRFGSGGGVGFSGCAINESSRNQGNGDDPKHHLNGEQETSNLKEDNKFPQALAVLQVATAHMK